MNWESEENENMKNIKIWKSKESGSSGILYTVDILLLIAPSNTYSLQNSGFPHNTLPHHRLRASYFCIQSHFRDFCYLKTDFRQFRNTKEDFFYFIFRETARRLFEQAHLWTITQTSTTSASLSQASSRSIPLFPSHLNKIESIYYLCFT